MADRDLERRIQDCLEVQIKAAFHNRSPRYQKLVIIAGNGLTLNAAGLRDPLDSLPWKKWCEEALKQSHALQTADYMLSLGYGLPDIFEYALSRAQELPARDRKRIIRQIWELLWDKTICIEPSPLHKAILQIASSVITTNYDDLFEEAAKRTHLSIVCKRLNITETKPIFEKFYPENDNAVGKTVWKIHGSFFPRGNTPEENRTIFDQWLHEVTRLGGTQSYQGPESTVADLRTYELLAGLPREQFTEIFRGVIDDLKGALVIFIGLGLGSQELVLTRLLQEVLDERDRPKMLSLVVSPSLDPLWKYRRFLISPLHIPLGLVASPVTRLLAHLIALESLAAYVSSSGTDATAICRSLMKDAFENPSNLKNLMGDSVPHTRPRIVAVGQASVNRVLGLETAVSQEMAYAPRNLASWGPEDSALEKKWLTNLEVGGQTLVPVMVWDALGIPSSIVARIYADDLGRTILTRLEQTQWVDFEWVGLNQQTFRPPFLPESVPATENSTIVTWFGLRTILDSYRQLRRDENPNDTGLVFEINPTESNVEANNNRSVFQLGAPLLYATKVRWDEIHKEIARLTVEKILPRLPLIVYDTGGQGKVGAEAWVAENEGIIVASALAGLVWLLTPRAVLRDIALAQNSQSCLSRKLQARGPKDDRGRLCQILGVLKKLASLERRHSRPPAFLEDGTLLNRARAFIVTLGELGAVYWIREGRRWSDARWSGPVNLSGSIEEIEFRETRSGLECGDVARAGLAASLLTNLIKKGVTPEQLTADDIQWAIGWANWFGSQKLRFFSLDGYLAFLKTHALSLEHLQTPQSATFSEPYAFGHCDRCKRTIRFSPLCSNGALAPTIAEWYQKAQDLFDHPVAWRKQCQEWRDERYNFE